MSDRRAHPRISGPFEGSWEGAGREAGRVVELSVSGCFLETMTTPAAGLIVDVSITLTGGRVTLRGQVISAEPNLGFSVNFVDVPAEAAELLSREVAGRLAQ